MFTAIVVLLCLSASCLGMAWWRKSGADWIGGCFYLVLSLCFGVGMVWVGFSSFYHWLRGLWS